jgi:RNA polymerase sigma-70 factor, ECF subfamily
MAGAHDEDAELMLRVGAGEPAAFETLVARMLPRLLGFFRRLGADAALAEDLAQDVFLKLYRGRQAYVPRARFTTFLLHIARNHWIDVYRHRKLGPRTLSTEAGTASAEGDDGAGLGASLRARGPEPSQAADQASLRVALERALAALDAGPREVFVLAHVHGLPYEEIAAILEIPVGTVKSRVHTATRALRQILASLGVEP